MPKHYNRFPQEGDFVVARVADIRNQYVYLDLIDYEGLPSERNARGMLHISEISSRWVKSIRNFLREGQRVVLRVIRVDNRKGHVDLSLRRTNTAQRKSKMKDWKYSVKLENLLQFLADEYDDMTLIEAYVKIGFPIIRYFNENYQEIVEELKENGGEILDNLTEIPQEVKKRFLEIIDENVEISVVKITGKLKLRYIQGNGVDLIKETLKEAQNVLENPKRTRNLEISYIAAPFYRVEITSKDYLDAEKILSDALEVVENKVAEYDGSLDFQRK